MKDAETKKRVLIVEDHTLMRVKIAEWLSMTFAECDFLKVQSGTEAIAATCNNQPDIVLLDVGQSWESCMEEARTIKACAPQTKVILLGSFECPAYRYEAVKVGVEAYVLKRNIHSALLPAVRHLLSRD